MRALLVILTIEAGLGLLWFVCWSSVIFQEVQRFRGAISQMSAAIERHSISQEAVNQIERIKTQLGQLVQQLAQQRSDLQAAVSSELAASAVKSSSHGKPS